MLVATSLLVAALAAAGLAAAVPYMFAWGFLITDRQTGK